MLVTNNAHVESYRLSSAFEKLNTPAAEASVIKANASAIYPTQEAIKGEIKRAGWTVINWQSSETPIKVVRAAGCIIAPQPVRSFVSHNFSSKGNDPFYMLYLLLQHVSNYSSRSEFTTKILALPSQKQEEIANYACTLCEDIIAPERRAYYIMSYLQLELDEDSIELAIDIFNDATTAKKLESFYKTLCLIAQVASDANVLFSYGEERENLYSVYELVSLFQDLSIQQPDTYDQIINHTFSIIAQSKQRYKITIELINLTNEILKLKKISKPRLSRRSSASI